MVSFVILQAGQSLVEGEKAVNIAGMPSKAETGLLNMVINGGPVMIPIILLSIVALFIFIDRFIAIRKAGKLNPGMMDRIKEFILDGKVESAQTVCRNENTPTSRMIQKGISRIGKPLADVTTAIKSVGNLEVSRLEKGLPILASVAGGAPMLGFLGTVIGMIEAFFDMANAGDKIYISILSSGIYHAMATTVAGLIVGIVAYFAYNILVSNVGKVVVNMEAITLDFMDILNEPTK